MEWWIATRRKGTVFFDCKTELTKHVSLGVMRVNGPTIEQVWNIYTGNPDYYYGNGKILGKSTR